MARILVTGGAGYIGSITTARLSCARHSATVLDNLSTGHRPAVTSAHLVEADLCDSAALDKVFSNEKFDAVMHFASHCYVDESVREPVKYFEGNVGNGLKLLRAMLNHGVRNFILSSTCATYGHPKTIPITEETPQEPINPYGESKLFLERILADYHRAYGVRYVSLRYFNACGASLDGKLGESHDPETHLIPLVLRAAATDFELTVYGDDYETSDGTCVRDYVHVEDLAAAHIAALEWLLNGNSSRAFNLGTGQGFSVKEIIACAERITGKKVRRRIGARRDGDPAVLVADASRARRELEWAPHSSDIDTIIRTAWNWFQHPRY